MMFELNFRGRIFLSFFLFSIVACSGKTISPETDFFRGQTIQEWVQQTKNGTTQLRVGAAQVLGKLTERHALPRIIDDELEPKAKEMYRSIFQSSNVPEISSETYQLLIEVFRGLTNDPDVAVMFAGIEAIGASKGVSGIPRLSEILVKIPPNDVWAIIPRNLAKIGTSASATVPLLIDKIKGASNQFRSATIEALGKIAGPEVFSIVSEDCRDPEGPVFDSAISTIGDLCLRFPKLRDRAFPLLSPLLSKVSEKKIAVVTAISKLKETAKDAIPIIIALLQDSNPSLRRAAVEALAAIAILGDTRVYEALKPLKKDPFPVVQFEALLACAKVGSDPLMGEIHKAIITGDLKKVTELLASDSTLVFSLGSDGEKFLHYKTPVDFALEFGQREILRHLLKQKNALNSENEMGKKVVAEAFLKDDAELLGWLIDAGLDFSDGLLGFPLILTAGDSPNCLRLLLAKGANPNEKTVHCYGRTPIHQAVESKNVEAVQVLLKAGADPNIPDNEGVSPIQLAMKGNAKRIQEILKSGGAKDRAHDPSKDLVQKWRTTKSKRVETFFRVLGKDLSAALQKRVGILPSPSPESNAAMTKITGEELGKMQSRFDEFRETLSRQEKFLFDFQMLESFVIVGHHLTLEKTLSHWKGHFRAWLTIQTALIMQRINQQAHLSRPFPAFLLKALKDLQGAEDEGIAVMAKHLSNPFQQDPLGKEFPAFPAGLATGDGKPLNLARLKGKATIMTFWAVWCPACHPEINHFRHLYDEFHGGGLEIVGFSFDRKKEDVDDFLKANKVEWHQYFDGLGWESKVAETYGISSIPQTYLLDKSGIVVLKNPSPDQLKAKILELLPGFCNEPRINTNKHE